MKKNKKNSEEAGSTLRDLLNEDVLSKLNTKKNSLKQQAEEQKDKERKERIAERKRIEKNKSFEELFNESDMDWKKYK